MGYGINSFTDNMSNSSLEIGFNKDAEEDTSAKNSVRLAAMQLAHENKSEVASVQKGKTSESFPNPMAPLCDYLAGLTTDQFMGYVKRMCEYQEKSFC
jgi:hypothetical protein